MRTKRHGEVMRETTRRSLKRSKSAAGGTRGDRRSVLGCRVQQGRKGPAPARTRATVEWKTLGPERDPVHRMYVDTARHLRRCRAMIVRGLLFFLCAVAAGSCASHPDTEDGAAG